MAIAPPSQGIIAGYQMRSGSQGNSFDSENPGLGLKPPAVKHPLKVYGPACAETPPDGQLLCPAHGRLRVPLVTLSWSHPTPGSHTLTETPWVHARQFDAADFHRQPTREEVLCLYPGFYYSQSLGETPRYRLPGGDWQTEISTLLDPQRTTKEDAPVLVGDKAGTSEVKEDGGGQPPTPPIGDADPEL